MGEQIILAMSLFAGFVVVAAVIDGLHQWEKRHRK